MRRREASTWTRLFGAPAQWLGKVFGDDVEGSIVKVPKRNSNYPLGNCVVWYRIIIQLDSYTPYLTIGPLPRSSHPQLKSCELELTTLIFSFPFFFLIDFFFCTALLLSSVVTAELVSTTCSSAIVVSAPATDDDEVTEEDACWTVFEEEDEILVTVVRVSIVFWTIPSLVTI